jgi:serine/threonine protein kinase/cytochrome c-type biogenesis protein CcmH/NrfG
MNKRGERIRELYEAALTRPPGERASYVARVAGDDTELRERVEALLLGQADTVVTEQPSGGKQAEPPLGVGTRIGNYVIERLLGAGGMGMVYLATDTKLNRPAAIKVLPERLADAEARRRFQREAQMVSSLNHPHIVTVYDAAEYQRRQYLITEYVDGGTLRQWASRRRSWQAIVELLIGVADGIAVAHEAGILHRDIKPENILLAKNGYAKLADFGIAKLLESDPLAEDPDAPAAGQHSTRVGTLAYMSPEQWQGWPLDQRSDVYSFGLVLYELLAGRRLEAADQALPRQLLPLPPEVPAELRRLVAKALEEEPANRYQTMRDLVVDLRRLARQSGTQADRRSLLWRPLVYVPVVVAIVALGFLTRSYVRDAFNGTASPRAIAVLPFVNESSNPDDAPISERLGDNLRDRLQELSDLDVIGRVSSLSFRDQQVDMRTIARTLGVGRLINASLQRRGDTLDVRVEILDERGFTLQPLSYQEPDTALLVLQQEIADDVTAFFDPDTAAPATTTAEPPSQNEPANKLILFGSHLEHEVKEELSVDEEKLAKAIDYYRRATQADPGSIEAYSRLAAALLYHGDVEGADAPLSRALDLGRSLAPESKSTELSEVYYSAALFLMATRHGDADGMYQRALVLNPNNVEAIGGYAQWLMTHNRSDDAEAYFKKAIRLEPLSLSGYGDYAEYLGTRDDIEPLRELAGEIEQQFPNARGYLKLARVYELTGDLDVGIAYGLMAYRRLTNERAVSMGTTSQKQLVEDARGQIGELYARIGDFEQASEFDPPEASIGQLLWQGRYEQLIDVAQERTIDRPDDSDAQYYLAFAYNATGDFQYAKYLLEQLGFPLAEGTPLGGPESQALTYYIDALQSLGGNDAEVQDLASKRVEDFALGTQTGMDKSWWVNTMLACSEAQLGRTSEAVAAIDPIYTARGLPFLYLLQDSPCFKRIAKEPKYVALIEHLMERKRMWRERLPATLEEYGVADVQP